MKAKIVLCIVLISSFALSGCRSMRTELPQTMTVAVEAPSVDALHSAIFRAGVRLGWDMKDFAPGVVRAELRRKGKYLVVSEVRDDEKGYSIFYIDSENMEFRNEDGQLNKNYNRWVRNLSKEIQLSLY